LNCGRRWGKTTEAIEEIKAKAVYHPRRIAYIAPTYQQARDIAWEQLKKELAPITISANESRLELRVLSMELDKEKRQLESMVVLRGWEAIETLRGQFFDFIVIDEVASMRNFWQQWQDVIRPTLVDKNGEVLFISTPKGFNHFYDLFNLELDVKKGKDYKSFHFTSYDNPHIPHDELAKMKEEMSEDSFAQEILADFRKTEGLVYKEFDRAKHLFEEEPIKVIEYLAGIDFGFNHPAAVIHVKRDHDGNYWVTEEWVKTKRTENQIAEYVASCKFNRVYPDPENPSAIEVLNQRSIAVMEVVKGKGSVQTGISKVRELFKQNRLFIHKSCINLINELETYSYPDKEGRQFEPENPIKEHDDALDALRYVITGSFELSVRPAEEEEAERLLSRLKNQKPLTR
jgi:PBSX family phage terminase large subunit